VSPRVIPKTPAPAEQRRQALAEATTRVDEAEALGRVADDLRRDIVRMEQQRDALAALGDRHVEIVQKSFDQRFRVEIEWQPIRSKLTGNQLAAEIENSIVELRQQLASTESRIEGLLHE
jgi:hypothetical protein